jgi:hypothetical protein
MRAAAHRSPGPLGFVYRHRMRALFGTLALAALLGCDPAPPSYAQYRYPDSTGQPPPPQQQPQPQPSAYPTAGQPPPGYSTTQVQPSYTTTQVQPGGAGSPPPTGPYTTTQIQPGYAPAAPPPAPMPPMPQPGPDTYPNAPPAGSLASGQYACWQVGMGGYVASNLISVTINNDGTYKVAGYNNGGGTYRADSVSIYMSSGPLNGWVGAIGANAKGPLVRFRPDVPNSPGPEMRQGDHLCFLHF